MTLKSEKENFVVETGLNRIFFKLTLYSSGFDLLRVPSGEDWTPCLLSKADKELSSLYSSWDCPTNIELQPFSSCSMDPTTNHSQAAEKRENFNFKILQSVMNYKFSPA